MGLLLVERDHRDADFIRVLQQRVHFQKNRLARLDREHGTPNRVNILDRVHSHRRNIEAKVLVGFTDLNHDASGPRQHSAPLDRGVGSLDRLHCDHYTVSYNDGLADPQTTDFFADAKPQTNVLPLRGIGRRSAKLNKASIALARKLAESEDAAPRWIGKDALRELSSAAVQKRLSSKA